MGDAPLETPIDSESAVERDLWHLAADRCSDALHSVLQLTDDPKVKFRIAAFALGTSFGATAGIFAAAYGIEKDEGLGRELAIEIITLCDEARKKRGSREPEPEK